jgi:hypothetical protein
MTNTDKIRYVADHPNGDGLDYFTSEDGKSIAYFLYARTPNTRPGAMMRVGVTSTEDYAQATKEAIDLAPGSGPWLVVAAEPAGFAPITIRQSPDDGLVDDSQNLDALFGAASDGVPVILETLNGHKYQVTFETMK